MTDVPRVSLIMPVHNRVVLLGQVLGQLAENTTYPNVELVTVDDRSTDGSLAILQRWAAAGGFTEMKVIKSPGEGAITALNTALNAATGEFCVQLDDDVTIETPGWIERMLELMLVDEAVGVVTAKVVFDSGHIQCCGVNVVGPGGWHERPMRPSEPIGRRLFLNRVKDRPREGQGGIAEQRTAEVDSGIGCCMMYRREDALAAGGYDQNYSPVWFDDVDLCIGIRRLGRKVFCLPDVRAIHHFAARAPEGPKARLRRLNSALTRRAVGRVPYRVRSAVERRYNVDLQAHYTREQCARLRHHHDYWRQKWDWDALNPDMEEVQRRWGDTEICWGADPERRAEGERIVHAFEAGRAQSGLSAA